MHQGSSRAQTWIIRHLAENERDRKLDKLEIAAREEFFYATSAAVLGDLRVKDFARDHQRSAGKKSS
jgi:isocitrate dehydrogenase kinase/phosphatase